MKKASPNQKKRGSGGSPSDTPPRAEKGRKGSKEKIKPAKPSRPHKPIPQQYKHLEYVSHLQGPDPNMYELEVLQRKYMKISKPFLRLVIFLCIILVFNIGMNINGITEARRINCDANASLSEISLACGIFFLGTGILFAFGIKKASAEIFTIYLNVTGAVNMLLIIAFAIYNTKKRCEEFKEMDQVLIELCVAAEIAIMGIFMILGWKLRSMGKKISGLKKKVHESFNFEDI